ncbi:GtrA family protein, partial [Streptococcus pneumoniae]
IGQFVTENIDKINAIETIIAQIFIIIINYILSKVYIFRK